MRKAICVLAATFALLATSLASYAGDDAKQIIERAIKAHGGMETINKFKFERATSSSKGVLMGNEYRGKGTMTIVYPDRFKSVGNVESMGLSATTVEIFTPRKHSMTFNGESIEVLDVGTATARRSMEMYNMIRLTPLLERTTNPDTKLSKANFALKALAQKELGGKTYNVVEASGVHNKGAKLYFDATTALLARFEWIRPDNGTVLAYTFSNYKDTSGVKMAYSKNYLVAGALANSEVMSEIKLSEKNLDNDLGD